MWFVHWDLLLRWPRRLWVCPCEGRVWKWCGCLGHRGSGSASHSGVWQLGQQVKYCFRGVWQSVLANTLQYSHIENPLPDRESCHSQRGRKVSDSTEETLRAKMQESLAVAALPEWQLSMKLTQLLGLRDPGSAKWPGTWTASTARIMALSEYFFEPTVAGNQKASLASISP